MKYDKDHPYPFHGSATGRTVLRSLDLGNYYGSDPYNTVDAPKLRQKVHVASRKAGLDAWAQIGQLMFGGKRA